MSLRHEPQQERGPELDAGFWRATAAMAVISAVLMLGVLLVPLDRILPEAANVALPIDKLFRFMSFFSVPIMVFVYGYMIYFIVRYRHRPSDSAEAVGSPVHDNRKLETWWTIVPAALMLTLGILSYLVLPQYYLAQAGTATLEAIGHKWFYEFRYPGLKSSVFNTLHLPVGVPLTLDITSAEVKPDDAVIHSFWVPEFRVKQDMVPGMVVPLHFTPTRIGTYPLICTEFCGVGHSKMRAQVVVESQKDFNGWFERQKSQAGVSPALAVAGGDAAAGKTLFDQKCTACHNAGPFEQRKVGPGLGNVFHDPRHPSLVNGKPANVKNVADILQHGYQGDMGVMPNMQANGLSAQDIANLVAYLQSLHR